MTELQRYIQREQHNRKELMRLLQCTDEQLNHMLFEGAYEYLQHVFRADSYGLEHLPKTHEFWVWWRMEWNRIDTLFLQAISHKYSAEYPQWYCVIRDRDTDDLHAVHSVNGLRTWYITYHKATMGNKFINSSVVRAGAHHLINTLKEKSHAQ